MSLYLFSLQCVILLTFNFGFLSTSLYDASQEQFIKYLGEKTGSVIEDAKRKTVKDTDLEVAIHRDDKLEFLKDDFPLTEG